MKNPDWSREELVLALDLYFKLDYGQMHGTHPKIKNLSQELRILNSYKLSPLPEDYRSPGSVSLKLANFKRFDQNREGKGMKHGGQGDREIWKEFHKHKDKLNKEASLIKDLYLKNDFALSKKQIFKEPEPTYSSDFLFNYHKNTETNPLTIKLKKSADNIEAKSLKCEICRFDPVKFYGELGNDLMQIHYKKFIKNSLSFKQAELQDFIIVCCNCHSVLDKHYGLIDETDLKRIIKGKR